jgi:hypothetical protein
MTSPDRDPSVAHERSGRDVEESIARAEAGTDEQGRHTLENSGPSGDSRVERMADVEETTEGRVDRDDGDPAAPLEPGPSPADVGSGGAQKVEGARISDRVAGSKPVPDSPPFDEETRR